MAPPPLTRPSRTRLPQMTDAPAATVVLVVAVLAVTVVPLAQVLGEGAGAQHGLEPFLELMAVLLGLLVVTVSLHTLDAPEQGRANVLAAGFGVAAACNFLHGVLAHSTPVHMPSATSDISLWLSSWARLAETVTLLLMGLQVAAPGPARAWLAGAGAVALLLVVSSLGPLPAWFASSAGGGLRRYLACVLIIALAVAALWFYRGAQRRERVLAWAALAFLCGEVTVATLGGHSPVGGPLAHGLRVVAYALLYQAVFNAGIRLPFARVQEVGSSRVDLQACKLEYSIVSPK